MHDGLASAPLRWTFSVITWGAYALLLVPIALIGVSSLIAPQAEGGWSLGFYWYARLFRSEQFVAALANSLQIALSTSVIATVLGTLGALAIERGSFPGRRLFDALTVIPLVMPELVMGIAMLLWFAAIRMTLGMHSVVLAHVTFAVSYVVVVVRASLRGFDASLLDAAQDLGASSLQVYTRVVLPLIAPGVVAGCLMAFCLSFDDFLLSFFTSGVGSDTLPLKLYAWVRFGVNKEMYALSTLLIAMAVGAVFLQGFLLKKRR